MHQFRTNVCNKSYNDQMIYDVVQAYNHLYAFDDETNVNMHVNYFLR